MEFTLKQKKTEFYIFFLKILFRFGVYNFFIFAHTLQWTLSEFLLFFWFSSRKPQSLRKVAKEITQFTIQFCSKNLTNSKNLNSLDIENNILLQSIHKPFSLYKFSSQHFSVCCQKKHLHHFLTPKSCILEVKKFLCKKIFVP